MKFSKKLKRKNISDNLLNPVNEEAIAGLMYQLIIMMCESENKEKEVIESKTVDEVLEELLLKETSTTEENASILLNRDVDEESIDLPEDGERIVDCPVLEVIDVMKEVPKPQTEIKHEKVVTKNVPNEI